MKNSLICILSFLTFISCNENSTKEHETQVNEQTSTPIKNVQEVKNNETMEFDISYIMGKFEPSDHKDFTIIEEQYASRKGMYLRIEAYQAFLKMHEAAASDGIDLKILSATRNFNAQKRIWEAKWTGERLVQNNENLASSTPDPKERALKILRWSSMPGSSRHHWGTDIDLNDFENEYFESGEGLKVYNWLVKNAPSFGYCQPYTAKNDLRPNGYNEEKWHWSYLPIAKPLSDAAKAHLKNEMIEGFKGSETAVSIDILNNFILGINNACL
jgi:LAS superfamily LD-carboxypeptidase LdcB